jgi:hypothetical protein
MLLRVTSTSAILYAATLPVSSRVLLRGLSRPIRTAVLKTPRHGQTQSHVFGRNRDWCACTSNQMIMDNALSMQVVRGDTRRPEAHVTHSPV